MNTKDDALRINELIAELSECRQDERNTQNQILQVISVAGAVLGILLGASYFDKGRSGGQTEPLANNFFTYQRILFLFCFVIFSRLFRMCLC